MEENVLVSVAMATFNGEKYLREQLDSILNQSYPIYEVVISDDNSNDGTKEIIKAYIRMNGRIKLLEQTEHVGVNKNFQQTLVNCTGQLIAISDQDNVWRKDKLEIMTSNMKDNILLYSDSQVISSDGARYKNLSETKKYKFTCGESPKEFYFYNAVFGHNMIFKRELLDQIFPLPATSINYDGWISFVASCVGKIGYIHQPLTFYRLHADNITHQPPATVVSRKGKKPKWIRRQAYNHNLIKRLEAFSTYKGLDKTEHRFLNIFISELKGLDESYFRTKLGWMMLRHHSSMLHHKKRLSSLGKAFSQAIGIKFYKLLGRWSSPIPWG